MPYIPLYLRHKRRTLCIHTVCPLTHNAVIFPIEKIVAYIKQQSSRAALLMPRCHNAIIFSVNATNRRVAKIRSTVLEIFIYHGIAFVFFKNNTVGRICHAYRLYLFGQAYRGIKEVEHPVLFYCRSRLTAVFIIPLIGRKYNR